MPFAYGISRDFKCPQCYLQVSGCPYPLPPGTPIDISGAPAAFIAITLDETVGHEKPFITEFGKRFCSWATERVSSPTFKVKKRSAVCRRRSKVSPFILDTLYYKECLLQFNGRWKISEGCSNLGQELSQFAERCVMQSLFDIMAQ